MYGWRNGGSFAGEGETQHFKHHHSQLLYNTHIYIYVYIYVYASLYLVVGDLKSCFRVPFRICSIWNAWPKRALPVTPNRATKAVDNVPLNLFVDNTFGRALTWMTWTEKAMRIMRNEMSFEVPPLFFRCFFRPFLPRPEPMWCARWQWMQCTWWLPQWQRIPPLRSSCQRPSCAFADAVMIWYDFYVCLKKTCFFLWLLGWS